MKRLEKYTIKEIDAVITYGGRDFGKREVTIYAEEFDKYFLEVVYDPEKDTFNAFDVIIKEVYGKLSIYDMDNLRNDMQGLLDLAEYYKEVYQAVNELNHHDVIEYINSHIED
jgi:hypothetical protein